MVKPGADFWDRDTLCCFLEGSQSGGGGSHTRKATLQRGREEGKRQHQGSLKGERAFDPSFCVFLTFTVGMSGLQTLGLGGYLIDCRALTDSSSCCCCHLVWLRARNRTTQGVKQFARVIKPVSAYLSVLPRNSELLYGGGTVYSSRVSVLARCVTLYKLLNSLVPIFLVCKMKINWG